MNPCIYRCRCSRKLCDESCPALVETSYLMERNHISILSDTLKHEVCHCVHGNFILDKLDTVSFLAVETNKTIEISEILTCCAIHRLWNGNQMHCTIYHLKYSGYIDDIQKSWSYKEQPEQLQYEEIFISSAKILIISSIDYVQFKDFQAQTLLNILHNRKSNGLKTIVVTPKVSTLAGTGQFYVKLQKVLKEAVIVI